MARNSKKKNRNQNKESGGSNSSPSSVNQGSNGDASEQRQEESIDSHSIGLQTQANIVSHSVRLQTQDGFLGTVASPMHVMVRNKDFVDKSIDLTWKISVVLLLSALLFITVFENRGQEEELHEQGVQPCMGSNVTFNDIKGVDVAKAELEEIVYYLRDPERFTRLGGKLPKGVLLIGPPGTGKTMLARAISAEAAVPFFSSRGGDFLGARSIRNLFSSAKKQSPCIIFIDELDTIGGTRNEKESQTMKMTLNQLLVEMDGFNQNEGIVVIAATNYPESLDKALVRPGRFDHHVVVPTPDAEGRRQILEVHISKVPRGVDVDLKIIARETPGFTGAELANLVNSAALKAAIDGAKEVTMSHLEYAKDKIMMGTEWKSTVLSEESRKLAAFHVSGHAIVAMHVDGAFPVYKATIVPRVKSPGLVTHLLDKDEMSISRKQMFAKLNMYMGGRIAEEITFGEDEVTSGASSDIEQATSLARAMVTKYGMSKDIGLVFLNYDGDATNLSTDTRFLIEKEVSRLLEKAYNNARRILMTHRQELHTLADALLEYGTLSGSQIKALLSQANSQ